MSASEIPIIKLFRIKKKKFRKNKLKLDELRLYKYM